MTYDQQVGSRFHIYNSLFLNLPFRDISKTGTLLPLLQIACHAGFEKGEDANIILESFFEDYVPHAKDDERFEMLFHFIQYVERQVALFDSIEDAAFEGINDVRGRGTVAALLTRAQIEKREDDLKARLNNFSVRVVLTAHPTQFYPGHVLGILTDLEKAIRESDLDQIDGLLKQLGKTGFINKDKPTPYDEAVSLTWFLENVFYHAIPQITEQICAGLKINIADWSNHDLMSIGFWPGGDRDGNPFVKSDITLKVSAKLRESILKCYYRDLRILRRRLTFQGVFNLVLEIERKVYQMAYEGTAAYTDVLALQHDLAVVRTKLISEHDSLFLELLDNFILKVKTFAFHFACLDIRQDSRKHEHVWKVFLDKLSLQNKTLNWQEFRALPEDDQISQLLSITANPVFLALDDDFAEDSIKTFLSIPKIQQINGERGCHRYVISNCQKAWDVLAVYQLAKLVATPGKELKLDVVPLFETIDDLAHAPSIMEKLYQVDVYRKHLESRGNRQTIMLGFSDGTKDGGYLRANWSIFETKEALTAISRKHGIKALFFDGRGGPPARGGGNTHDFYASLGETIEHEEVQITIQGQTISSNFGKVASCKYNLEQLLSAGVQSSVFERHDNHLSDDEKELLSELADEGYRAYLDLKHDPKFVPYLEKVTPLSFFGDTNIGSRPVKRSGSDGLKFEDLRAIPFVGSWAMMKQNIPGFYGVGTALQKLKERGKEDALKGLYQRSLFFRTLVGNSMMSLTKTYYPATRYLEHDAEFGVFWKKMYAEFELSRKMILDLSGLTDLMENNPSIKSSVRLRERIVLPLIAIQQFALMNIRNIKPENKVHELRYRKLIIRCMFGIINAARNSA